MNAITITVDANPVLFTELLPGITILVKLEAPKDREQPRYRSCSAVDGELLWRVKSPAWNPRGAMSSRRCSNHQISSEPDDVDSDYEPVLQAGTAIHAVESFSSEGGRGDSNEEERKTHQTEVDRQSEEEWVESWLDEHPEFTHNYFIRNAQRYLVEEWLAAHSLTQKASITSDLNDFRFGSSSLPASGTTTPARKISSQELDRGGLVMLKRIVNTNSDGTLSFIPPSLASDSSSVQLNAHCKLKRMSLIELQALEEKELIFELAKDICNDLDVRNLCHKILQNVSILTHADCCSLFLVRGDKPLNESSKSPNMETRYLVSTLFDVSSQSTVADMEEKEELNIPWGRGIVGYVASSGQSVNISDVYQDPRFNPEVDQKTGYTTKSMVCAPIKDADGEVVGVAQVINKIGSQGSTLPFDENDEKVFDSYLQFCGIGVKNAQLYERSELENKRNQILLDLARMVFEEQSTIEHIVYRIMTHTQALLQCQRYQVMLMHDGSKSTFSRVFDLDASDLKSEEYERTSPFEGRFPINFGITGYVASTGQTLNIPDAYSDERFDPSVDKSTNFRTRSILCMSIKNSANKIIGVSQLINKLNGCPFNKNDENLFEAFSIFCGSGIHNTQMYESVCKANAKQHVTLEVLSYHATSPFEEAWELQQMERAQRSSSEEITITIRSDNQKLPVNLDMFWSSMLNKVRLQEYVFKWMLQNVKSDKEIFFGGVYGGECKKLLAGNETQIAELSSNQEEADDRIMFHINDGVVKHRVQSALVDSPDTDVFVNLIFHFNTTWQLQKLYVKLGNRKTKKTVPVHLLVDQLDNGLVSCLPAIHALSGCDSTSKVGPKLSGLKASIDLSLLEGFGVKELSPQITSNAEKFLVSGLKKTDCSTFDEYRWEQYHNSKKELDFNQLVCCSSTIREHIKRAYLQCKMWLQAPTPAVTKPDPLQYGYEATDVGITPVILPQEVIPTGHYYNLYDYKFSDFDLEDRETIKASIRMFKDLDLIERFHIDYEILCRWMLSVKKNYRHVTYHNWRHAFNVAQTLFTLLTSSPFCRIFGELECLALLVACFCHDLDHRGTNNSFQIKSSSCLAQLYSTSTMEHHHFDQCIMILNSQGNQIFSNLSTEDYSVVINVLEEAILATDLAVYFRSMFMTACDVSAITKPWEVQKVVAELVTTEFFQQGDKEKEELNLQPIDMMDRNKKDDLPKMQVTFIDAICLPVYEAFAELSDSTSELLTGCLENRKKWEDMINQ
ncbi:Dual 3',5'-cyclic-AMP and -GMP phosphodiesterase 11 [Nymphon striatum]|nr:Dual 3',5'-cyclic-AMP and -GMP phosphodiesterase 11 [Nymphon striatum]